MKKAMGFKHQHPLRRLADLGQSVWYDHIRRDLYQGSELKRLIEEDELRGMTSNPTLFAKAITETELYDADIRRLAAASLAAIFESLAVEDVRGAADVFRPVYESTGGDDGFVSIEVRPQLVRDTDGSIVEARRLWSACDRPNVMVKIPATAERIPAIRQCLAEASTSTSRFSSRSLSLFALKPAGRATRDRSHPESYLPSGTHGARFRAIAPADPVP